MKFLLALTIFTLSSITLIAQWDYEHISKCIHSPDTLNGMEVLRIVEQPPEYIGGMGAFYKRISKLIGYPKVAQRMGIDPKYVYTFVIDTLGNMGSFCLIKPDIQSPIDQNDIAQFNKWVPGEQRGSKVPVRLIVPVYIHLR